MEKWKEVFVEIILQGYYQTQITNGEDKGLILELKSDNSHVVLNFGMVQAVNIADRYWETLDAKHYVVIT